MAQKITLTKELSKKFSKKARLSKPRFIECRILIVCEGEKTEPKYFKSFNKKNNGVFVVDMSIAGGGINTIQVVDEAIRLKEIADKKKMPYDVVWAVFDRDSFKAEKFNAAIIKANANNVQCAWSNEAFELWYLLHFEYRNTPMSRKEYQSRIEYHINNSPLYKKKKSYTYKKNEEAHFDEMCKYGSLEKAIDNAKKLNSLFKDEKYANHNPKTLVFKLVSQLLGRDTAFNDLIKKRV